ncbi:metallophosphoesterase [Pelotomaculum sp. PtaB.Bin117]|uniref:metallophosphoesterase family protein n=1 Tax=Pelotomaculum sp. PtaB.Bin117 TaxID=1811694 RepID=UPI0009C8FE27|nr:metallophosphoesterase [Pelotomaculum sp. PtaB.Bin117]OPX92362.1 MAG: Phosphodiesterase YfcE [Pelotomaculum sp. PtaB.Bin117]
MRLAVFSDSHGRLTFAFQALRSAGPVDLILHAGDHCSDGLKLGAETGIPVKAVRGNCDYGLDGLAEEIVELSGRRILLTHGHLAGVKQPSSRGNLLAAARENGVEAVIFGHTHVAVFEHEGGVLLFNPGSIARPLDQERPSYGILEITGEGIIPYICRI